MAFETYKPKTTLGPIGVVNATGQRQSAQAFRQAAQSFEQLAGQEFQVAGQEAAQAGKIAGQNSVSLDADGNIVKSKVEGGRIFNNAFVQEQRTAEMATYNNKINAKSAEIVSKYQDDPDGVLKAADEIKAYQEALINNANPEISGYLNLQIQQSMGAALQGLSDNAILRSKQESKAEITTSLDDNLAKYQSMLTQGIDDDNLKLTATVIDTLLANAKESNVYSADEIAGYEKRIRFAQEVGSLTQEVNKLKTPSSKNKLIFEASKSGKYTQESINLMYARVQTDARIQAQALSERSIVEGAKRAEITYTASQASLSGQAPDIAQLTKHLDMRDPDNITFMGKLQGQTQDIINTNVNNNMDLFINDLNDLVENGSLSENAPDIVEYAKKFQEYKDKGFFDNRTNGTGQQIEVLNLLRKHAYDQDGNVMEKNMREMVMSGVLMSTINEMIVNEPSSGKRSRMRKAYGLVNSNPPMMGASSVNANKYNEAMSMINTGRAEDSHYETVYGALSSGPPTADGLMKFALANDYMPKAGKTMLLNSRNVSDPEQLAESIQLAAQLKQSERVSERYFPSAAKKWLEFASLNFSEDMGSEGVQKVRKLYNDMVDPANEEYVTAIKDKTMSEDFIGDAINFFNEDAQDSDTFSKAGAGQTGSLARALGDTGYKSLVAEYGNQWVNDVFGMGDVPNLEKMPPSFVYKLKNQILAASLTEEIMLMPEQDRYKAATLKAFHTLGRDGFGFTQFSTPYDGGEGGLENITLDRYTYESAVANVAPHLKPKDVALESIYGLVKDNPSILGVNPKTLSNGVIEFVGQEFPYAEQFQKKHGSPEQALKSVISTMLEKGSITLKGEARNKFIVRVQNYRNPNAAGWEVLPMGITVTDGIVNTTIEKTHPDANDPSKPVSVSSGVRQYAKGSIAGLSRLKKSIKGETPPKEPNDFPEPPISE